MANKPFGSSTARHPDSAAYNMALPLRFAGEADAAALQRAVRQVLEVHPMLRAVFGEANGVPHQCPQAEISRHWLAVDASQWAEEGLMAQVHRFSLKPFVLEEGAFRATLFQGAEAAYKCRFLKNVWRDSALR